MFNVFKRKQLDEVLAKTARETKLSKHVRQRTLNL